MLWIPLVAVIIAQPSVLPLISKGVVIPVCVTVDRTVATERLLLVSVHVIGGEFGPSNRVVSEARLAMGNPRFPSGTLSVNDAPCEAGWTTMLSVRSLPLNEAVMVAHPGVDPVMEMLAPPVDDTAFHAGTLTTSGFEVANRTIWLPLGEEIVAIPDAVEPVVIEYVSSEKLTSSENIGVTFIAPVTATSNAQMHPICTALAEYFFCIVPSKRIVVRDVATVLLAGIALSFAAIRCARLVGPGDRVRRFATLMTRLLFP